MKVKASDIQHALVPLPYPYTERDVQAAVSMLREVVGDGLILQPEPVYGVEESRNVEGMCLLRWWDLVKDRWVATLSVNWVPAQKKAAE